MFSVEHEFSETRVILVDEGHPDLKEDIVLRLGDQGARIMKVDPKTGQDVVIELSAEQIGDLIAAMTCSEAVYPRRG